MEADTGSSDTGEEVGSSGSCSEAVEGWTLAPPPGAACQLHQSRQQQQHCGKLVEFHDHFHFRIF